MRRRTTIAIWLAACMLFSASGSQAKADPLARTRKLIDAFRSVESPPEGGKLSPAQRKANAAAFLALDGMFDYDSILSVPVEPHQSRFTPEQTEHYRKVFRELICIIAYPDSGAFFEQAQYELKDPRQKGGRLVEIDMCATLPKEDLETTVTFPRLPDKDGLAPLTELLAEAARQRPEWAQLVHGNKADLGTKETEHRGHGPLLVRWLYGCVSLSQRLATKLLLQGPHVLPPLVPGSGLGSQLPMRHPFQIAQRGFPARPGPGL